MKLLELPLMRNQWGVVTCILFCLVTFREATAQISFEDVTEQTGIAFKHFSGGTGKHFIVETVLSGLVTFDYNDDGLVDIYFLNGAPVHDSVIDWIPSNRLYRNDGDFRFTDVTAETGTGDTGFGLGAVSGDYDNDGDADLFISNFGATVLYENSGDGTFSRRVFETTQRRRVGAGLSLFDLDRDGRLDLYVANYVKFTFEKDVNRKIFGVPAAPGPKDYEPDSDSLYRNDGQGGFIDVSESSGIASVAGAGMAVSSFDFDEDGDTDVFVCNDSAANFLFENGGDGTFIESALIAGVAFDVTGAGQASMGADVGDINHDGHLDLVTTNFMDEIPTLYKNSGAGYFDDVGAAYGLAVADRSVSWGISLADFDNDSWLDLGIVAGHIIEGISSISDLENFASPNFILRNVSGAKFVDASNNSPPNSIGKQKVSRGLAVDDLDGDGLSDIVVLDLNSTPQVLRNTTATSGDYLLLELSGVDSCRSAAGAKIIVTTSSNETLVHELVLGRGYQSHFGTQIHVGLGNENSVKVEVAWPTGLRENFGQVRSNSSYLLREGRGKAVAFDAPPLK